MTDEQIHLVIQKINSYHSNPGYALYPGFEDIEEFIFQSFNIQIKRNTLRHIINLKLSNLFKTVIDRPMDSKRAKANIYDIDSNLNKLSEIIEGVHTNFIKNIDEIGNLKTLIAPASYNQLYAPYRVSRSITRSSCIAAISAAGLVCIPQVAITGATLDDDIYDYMSVNSAQMVQTIIAT